MVRRLALATALAAVLAVAVPTTGTAAPFNSLVVFGDSLSDNGNVFAATGGMFPPAPYAQRFSNGPVAVEYLAAAWGIPMLNLAYGGATTGAENFLNVSVPALGGGLPGMRTVFDAYIASLGAGGADPDALYFLWGGANDVFLANALGLDMPATLGAAVANLVYMTSTLFAVGAQHVMVVGMPDLGLTPAFDGMEANGTFITTLFNTGLSGAVQPLGATFVDTAGFLQDVVANQALYGFTNVDDPCLTTSPPSLCGFTLDQQNQYLYWDTVHPTTGAHMLAAAEFRQAVPEPAVVLLIATAMAAAMSRRRSRG
ncbi:MAG: SGNH/GDSL hydrolase family protein [Vicinamibacteraceae bacterium]|nr:SGNH/GDSL hydrolase family protein [Vicinamibacteraceae bacterium]